MEPKQEKLYVITLSDLPVGDQATQACHAVEAWKHRHPNNDQVHTMAVLVVPNSKFLEFVRCKLLYNYIDHAIFQEPDLENRITAIACLTDRYNIFKGLKKLGE